MLWDGGLHSVFVEKSIHSFIHFHCSVGLVVVFCLGVGWCNVTVLYVYDWHRYTWLNFEACMCESRLSLIGLKQRCTS